ncbi:MAG: NAD(P)H-dependent FMN reductase [Vicingaceae bacterium]|jgi:NAD(P)H-dependent FMN reductase
MTKIVAFGASSSKTSINKQLANYAAQQVPNADLNLLDLNDYEMPVYSIDKENESGIHPLALKFRAQLDAADGIIISFAEHNGAYSAAFKNIFDWISRGGPNIWGNKPMFLLSTSPGARGGQSVLEIAVGKISRMNTNDIHQFSLPEFEKNFDNEITNNDLKAAFTEKLNAFTSKLA